MRRLVAEIRNGEYPIRAEPVLHAGVPLRDAWRVNVRWQERLGVRERERDILPGRRQRERIATRHRGPRIGELVRPARIRYLRAVGRILRHHAVWNEGSDGI